MATDNNNPFILPGLGQTGDLAQNPILASMEMMQQAWQGLAGAGSMGGSPMSPPTSIEELDRRIKDLRAVENWLRMNLSMLSSTIQGLEVQSATLSTLQSFMGNVAGAASSSTSSSSSDGPSPLEVALGIRRPGQQPAPQSEPSAPTPSAASQPASSESATTGAGSASPESGTDAAGPDTDSAYATQAAAAAQGWWNMLQQQFDTLAAATAATLESAQTAGQDAQSMATSGKAAKAPATKRSASSRKTPTKTARKTASKPAAKKATKAAAKTSSKASAKAGSAASGSAKRSAASKAGASGKGSGSKT
ncbi:PhaM family polyhydroxyalkanoate granule multifunctional regulatory protein [Allopusillimonas ginsengisoli]|uniref:PhaM family polyhydroxyalkanoate granule multifunctional regulatory protein n=1 Tax=Allopusillimonas ginsengisoli TaxID=453575 RepID=UPI0039C222EA